MERPHLEETPAEIEVLDGQMSVEELLAELGFDWHACTSQPQAVSGAAAEDPFGQPALF